MGNNCCSNAESQVLTTGASSERLKVVTQLRAIAEATEPSDMMSPRPPKTIVDIAEESRDKALEEETIRAEAVEKLQEIISNGAPFTDEEFPARLSSIYCDVEDDVTKEEREVYGKLIWKRASEIFDSPQVFVEGIEPNDIKQGYLGDCYLLATLSAMCENPS